MTDENAIAVEMSPAQWRLVQEALDVYYYETEHERHGTISPSRRERRRLKREERLQALVEVDRLIGTATGQGPLLG